MNTIFGNKEHSEGGPIGGSILDILRHPMEQFLCCFHIFKDGSPRIGNDAGVPCQKTTLKLTKL